MLAMANIPFFLLLTSLLLSNGCSHFLTAPTMLPFKDAPQNLHDITGINKGLETFKGLGTLTLKREHGVEKYRIAWACKSPDKIRLVIIVAGQVVETLVADGESLFLRSETNAHEFIKKNTDNADLERILSIPVKINDIIQILSGRIPVAKHHGFEAVTDTHTGLKAVVLNAFWGREVQRVIFNKEGFPCGFEIKKSRNHVLYDVKYENLQINSGFILPGKITIKTRDNIVCTIKTDSFFPNASLAPDVFFLSSECGY
jgi:outer membrane lipoprotein-sorting protein